MSARVNGFRNDRQNRPSSETMVELHVYLVPPNIWREKFNNALNQNINDTVSIGFIRVHPETKVIALRDEIEQQLGAERVPREYVFLKSVGRSLTRLKSKQEATLKAKNFLPPQAYAPELYLLEATPEVQQAIVISSDGSTRPQTRTSYEYEYHTGNRQSDDYLQNAKNSNIQNDAGYNTYQHQQQPLPQIIPHDNDQPSSVHQNQLSQPIPIKSSVSQQPHSSLLNEKMNKTDSNNILADFDKSSIAHVEKFDTTTYTNIDYRSSASRHFNDIRMSHTSSDSLLNLHVDSPHHQLVDFPQQHQEYRPSDKFQKRPHKFQPALTTLPPHIGNEKAHGFHGSQHEQDDGYHGSQYKDDADSGIARFVPETYRKNEQLDRQKADQEIATDQLKPSFPKVIDEDSDPLNRSQDDQDLLHWNKKQQEDQGIARREEEEEWAKQEALQKKFEENHHQMINDVKLMKTKSDEDLTRFPSPPPLRLASPDKYTASEYAQRKKQKDELLKELEEAKEARRVSERQREELVKQAKQMQNKTQNKRSHARDLWKKKYFDEKKKTGPLEEQSSRLRHELDIIHKRLLTTLEGPKEKATKLNDLKGNSQSGSPTRPLNNFKIRATRLQHEIEEIQHRVDHAKMKLTTEMKLRNQAETELRALRAELMQKKINLTLSRNSHLTTFAPPAADINFMTARSTAITPRS